MIRRDKKKPINLFHRYSKTHPVDRSSNSSMKSKPRLGQKSSLAEGPSRVAGRGDSKSIAGITRRDQSMVEPLFPLPPSLSRREETRPHNGAVGREKGGG